MEAFIQSSLLVFAGEMGDKTQLLALLLVGRYRRPWTILLGILIATLLNHLLAAAAGAWLASLLPPSWLRWALAATFFAFALWILQPDEAELGGEQPRFGVLATTIVAFFLAEMGDKTQLATIALGARFGGAMAVTLGSTVGMVAANAPAVFLGQAFLARIPLVWVRRVAAALFLVFGLLVLFVDGNG